MDKRKTFQIKSLVIVVFFWLIVSCESDNGLTQAIQDGTSDGQNVPGIPLEDESTVLVIPEGTNLRINYVDPAFQAVASKEYILQQWNGMKRCLEIEVPDGYIVVEREVIPTLETIDVIQLPDQSFAAAATDGELDGLIQILVDDFDPTIADRGYFFRQIIGPYMWRYNGLEDRRYDPNCAAFVVM